MRIERNAESWGEGERMLSAIKTMCFITIYTLKFDPEAKFCGNSLMSFLNEVSIKVSFEISNCYEKFVKKFDLSFGISRN